MVKRSSRTLLAVLAIVFGLIGLGAQEYRGSLFGNVTDSTGARVPNAKITITNKATGVTTTVESSSTGTYSAQNLNAGMYKVTADAPGFSTLVRENVEVRIGEMQGLDLSLKPGAVGQEVVVTAEPAALVTDTGSGGTLLSNEMVDSMPLLGSNVYSLIQTTAGASHGSAFPDHLSERPFDNGGMDGYAMNGAPAGGANNAYVLDGSPNNDNEGLGFVPPPDAVNEINVIVNGYDAELGNSGGGVTSVALKTGTNNYHGDVYGNVRNNHLNANLYQNYGKPEQVTQWSELGFQVGGPVSIPHLFSGKDHAFFAVSYEHFFDKLPASDSWEVPSPSQAAGNFCSGAPGNNGIGTVIYDPTTSPRTAFGGCPAGQTGSMIPANRIDPAMAQIMSLLVPSNVPGCSNPRSAGCATNFASPYRHADNYHAETVRMDYNFNPNEQFFATYVNGNRLEYIGDPGQVSTATAMLYPITYTWRINHGASANLTSILSPTLTSTARINWLRHDGLGSSAQEGSATGLGLSPSLTTLFGNNNSPGLNFSTAPTGVPNSTYQYSAITAGGTNQTTLSDSWTGQETLNKVIRSHSIKGGGGLTTILQNNRAASLIPVLYFSDVFTRANYLAADQSGDAVATALLGYPTQINYTNPFSASYKTTYIDGFVQDDWRFNKKLTLNLGLRWDMETPPHERFNRAVTGFNAAAPSLVAGSNGESGAVNGGGGQYLGGLVYADPNNRSPFAPYYRGFAPRFGFAYEVTNKMVLRGGWGKFMDYAMKYFFPPSIGFTQTSSALTTSNGYQTPTLCSNVAGCSVPAGNPEAGISANGYASAFPNGLIPYTGSTLGARTGAGTTLQFIDSSLKPAEVNQFNLDLEYQLPSRTVLEFAYVGSRTNDAQCTNTPNIHSSQCFKSIDQLPASEYLSLGAGANASVTNPFAGMLPGTSLNGATTTARQLLLPFPQYTDVQELDLSVGKLWYNSLQVKVNKRLTNGLSFMGNFTWSRNLGATSWLNPNFDPLSNLTRQPVSIEQPFVTNLLMSYKEPFFAHGNRISVGALGGWTIAGNALFSSGTLIATPTGGNGIIWTGVSPTATNTAAFTQRTDTRWFNNCVVNSSGAVIQSSINAGCPASTPASQAPWQQTSSPYVLNNIPTFFEGLRTTRPPMANLSVFKSFPIHEQSRFELRGEAFNLTNVPWFGFGDNGAGINSTSATASTFGSIIMAQGNDPRILQISGQITF